MEKNQMPFSDWMVKESVVHLRHGPLLSNKRNELLIHAAIWVDVKALCWVGKKNLKKVKTVQFHLHNILKMEKL